MGKQGQKLSDELREQIIAHFATNGNIRETARNFNVSADTVRRIRDEKPDDFVQLRTDKREQMIAKIWENLNDAIELGHQMVKEAKQGVRDIPLNHISTYYGTLYDKQALMSGANTQNIGVNGQVVNSHEYHITQTIETDAEAQRLLESLYERSIRPTVPVISED